MPECDILLCNFIKITLWHRCFPVNLLLFSEDLFIRTTLKCCFCIHDQIFCKNSYAEKFHHKCLTGS